MNPREDKVWGKFGASRSGRQHSLSDKKHRKIEGRIEDNLEKDCSPSAKGVGRGYRNPEKGQIKRRRSPVQSPDGETVTGF